MATACSDGPPAGSPTAAGTDPPSATPTQADILADALATISLQSQPAATADPAGGSPTTSAPAASSSESPQTISRPPTTPTATPDPEMTPAALESLWRTVTELHDSRCIGYLAAMTQVVQASGSYSSDQMARAADYIASLLCRVAKHHADTHSAEEALAVMQAAFREALTTLPIDDSRTLLISIQLAHMLQAAGQYEPALKQWRWVAPRCERVAGAASADSARWNLALCLMRLHRHIEATPLFYDVHRARQVAYGDNHLSTIEALTRLVVCELSAPSLPPATCLPLLKQHIAHLQGSDSGDGDAEIAQALHRSLDALQACHMRLGDRAAAEKSARQWAQWTKRRFGVDHPHHIQALSQYGTNLLSLGQPARAASFYTKYIADLTKTPGADTSLVIREVVCLGLAFYEARKYDTAVKVFSSAWESAGGMWGSNAALHSQLFQSYARALFAAGDNRGANRLAKEARARGLPLVDSYMARQREWLALMGVDKYGVLDMNEYTEAVGRMLNEDSTGGGSVASAL